MLIEPVLSVIVTAIVAAADRARIVGATTIFRRVRWRRPGPRRRVDVMAVLLDRDAELTELNRRIAVAGTGSGGVVLIEGPAGISKSTLLAATGQIARADGATVLRARCSSLEQHAALIDDRSRLGQRAPAAGRLADVRARWRWREA